MSLKSLFRGRNEEEFVDDTYEQTEYDEQEDDDYVNLAQDEESDEYEQAEDEYEKNRNAPSSVLGQPSLLNVLGPSYWSTDDLMQDEFVMRENMKSKTYGIAAYVPPIHECLTLKSSKKFWLKVMLI